MNATRSTRERAGTRTRALLLAAAGLLLSPVLASTAWAQGVPSTIQSNFNGTAISAGNYIWFNAVFKYVGPESGPVTVRMLNSTLSFTAGSTTYNLAVPNSIIHLSPTATQATTVFDAGQNAWVTTTPFGTSGNLFLNARSFQVPTNIPGGTDNVTWYGEFDSNTGGVEARWKWGAAVYTTFSSDHGAIQVKPVDDNQASAFKNSDHAGTPENFKSFVIGGARGGGGSNFTGSYSGTASVFINTPVPAEESTWGRLKNLYH